MTHFMMLSDLYGRIGQILSENGDAPIGELKQHISDKLYAQTDIINPKYVNINLCKTIIDKVEIKNYNIIIEKQ